MIKATVPLPSSRVFGDAEQLLLNEARARFDFEQKSASTLHTKSALYLTVTGVFVALTASSISRLLDQSPRGAIAVVALVVFALCLGIFVVASLLLSNSALSKSYQVIATPRVWAQHLTALRSEPANPSKREDSLIQLEFDLLDAWIEAAEACAVVNAVKAATLHRVAWLISAAVPLGFLGILLLLLQSMLR
ncbi:MAG TPA: hypothetical protein VJ725_00790 [Thermoanaerobaculia bacterium]|nr:hypothetical protein [Thermoanaerobaculia bacterium]